MSDISRLKPPAKLQAAAVCPMLVKPGIIRLFFATFAAFCSTSASPRNGCGVEMEARIEQKTAKKEGVTGFQYVIEFASGG